MAAPYYVYGGNLYNRERYTSVVNTAFGDRRYFSSIDTDIYFGDTLIDEMVAFDFIIEEKKIPIYGYNNYVPKRIITGQKTIQGSFAINFTKTFNLKYILDEVTESIYANDYEVVQYFCADDNAAIFNKGFDITLSYGDAKDDSGFKSYNACTQTLVGCYITSYRQALDTSGEPILDMYTFIAKDLIIQNESINYKNKKDDENLADRDTGSHKGSKGPEDYIVWNTRYKNERDEGYNYCKQNPETLGVEIDPTYNYINGKSKIMMLISTSINDHNFKIEEIKIDVEDTSLSGTYTFKLNKKLSNTVYYYDMTGTHVEVGQQMKKLLGPNGELREEGLECQVRIKGSVGDKPYNIEYPTTLGAGTINASGGNNEGYDALSY